MSDWTAGYVADIGYTFGYYQELNPLRARVALLNAGYAAPDFKHACELGFGQGVSINMHAAGASCRWFGTDFNPAQAGFAQHLSAVAGSDAGLFDESFAEFSQREDLPVFDFIGLHGIWSWISDANRLVIVDFIRRRLKVGGVLYISYNTLPGWSSFMPMRDLLCQHAEVMGTEDQGITGRINGALEFANEMMGLGSRYTNMHPAVASHMGTCAKADRRYLAHEFFNQDWSPQLFSTVAETLAQAKVQYAGYADYLDRLAEIQLTPPQQAFLAKINDPVFAETTRDFIVNRRFRQEYWVKGARRLSPQEKIEQMRAQSFVMILSREKADLKIKGGLGDATLSGELFVRLLDFFADYQPHTLGDMELHIAGNGTIHDIWHATLLMMSAGYLAPTHDAAEVERNLEKTRHLNALLKNKARYSGDIPFLVSPLLGGGVKVDRFHQIFVMAHEEGVRGAEALVDYAWQLLMTQGQKLMKEGVPLETPEQCRAELLAQAEEFVAQRAPILKTLGILV